MKKQQTLAVSGRASAYIKKRIVATRTRAQFVGLLYILATMMLAVLACLPMFTSPLAALGVDEFWKVFKNVGFSTAAQSIVFINAVFYTFVLLTFAVNLLRQLAKLNWLFKKRPSKVYGFNRNAYAMDDIGKLFSGSFAALVIFHFVIYLLCGSAQLTRYAYIALGVGGGFHFLCGLLGAKVSLFDIEKDVGVVEVGRQIGRTAPFIRNVLQIIATGAMMYLFAQAATIRSLLLVLLEKGGFEVVKESLRTDFSSYMSFGLQLFTVICLMVLIKHALATTEFDGDGTLAFGMKNFRVFSFFIFLTSGAAFVCKYLFGEIIFSSVGGMVELNSVKGTSVQLAFIAAIALVMFITEVVMRNMPHLPEEKEDELSEDDVLASDE